MRDVYGLACARHHSARVTRDQRAAQTGSLRNSGFARQLLVDARADFHRIGVAHGEAWTCLELAVVDAGNARTAQALALCDEAVALFASYGDRRGEDWARFLRCTLLPYAAPGGVEIGTAVAQEELAQLARAGHPARDEKLDDFVEAYQLLLERGVQLDSGWQAWRLRHDPEPPRPRGDGGGGGRAAGLRSGAVGRNGRLRGRAVGSRYHQRVNRVDFLQPRDSRAGHAAASPVRTLGGLR
ncbi:hypothetical protein SFUMM280S_07827 [Streptomyces fumanus]